MDISVSSSESIHCIMVILIRYRALQKESDRRKPVAAFLVSAFQTRVSFDVAPVCNSISRRVALIFLLSLSLRTARYRIKENVPNELGQPVPQLRTQLPQCPFVSPSAV